MNVTRLAALLVGILAAPLLATSARHPGLSPHAVHTLDSSPTLLEHVRQATEPFRDIRRAVAAGYGESFACVVEPTQAGTAWRVMRASYAGDGEIDAGHPAELIYESTDGKTVLAGVEYVVFAEAWLSNHPEPPDLEGQVFHYVDSPNQVGLPPHYELQVWAWRDNPLGTIVDGSSHIPCTRP